ncbi:MAG: class I SAM-dependent methyltransferase [Thermoproteota archaeon]|nr:class I SAM-dependent methyltransferase [Thermoproteota archaeon]
MFYPNGIENLDIEKINQKHSDKFKYFPDQCSYPLVSLNKIKKITMERNAINFDLEENKEDRFEFGKNWSNFLNHLTDSKVEEAQKSLSDFLNMKDLKGLRFIDVGCGSGLFSLAARKLGATVYSFDYDPLCVACTEQLKKRFFEKDNEWFITKGSVLDNNFVGTLGEFDIVYSWGVLHHTGKMWQAVKNAMDLVKRDGLFFIAIYNNQGWKSKFWWYIKFGYNKLPDFLKVPYALTLTGLFELINIIKYTILLKPQVAIKPLLNYGKNRGMSYKYDAIDWIGGFPYEFATTSELNSFFTKNNFCLVKTLDTHGLGCNQLIFKKTD